MFEKRNELGKFEDNKITFLNDNYDNEKTQITYYRIFKLFVDFEKIKDKDIALFSREELLESISTIPTYSKRTINTIDSTLTSYLTWAAQRGINPTGVNVMQGISVKEHLEKNINKNVLAKKFITEEEIKTLRDTIEKNEDVIINAQDYLCVLLPFYGIYGKDCFEIINLKEKDIDFIEQTITVYDENSNSRVVQVDKFLLNIIKEAIDEKEYIRKNNWKEALVENGYILKMTRRPDQLKPMAVRTRLRKCLGILNGVRDKQSRITMKSLVASGMYKKIKQVKQENGTVTDQDFREVMVLYGNNPNSYFGLKEDYYFVFGDKVD